MSYGETIKSSRLVDIINEFREDRGIIPLRHMNIMRKLRTEKEKFEGLGDEYNIELINDKYTTISGYREDCYLLGAKEVKRLIDTTTTTDLVPLNEIYKKLGGDIETVVCVDRFEHSFFRKLSDTLDGLNLELERQKHIIVNSADNDRYYVDGYIPEYGIAIEYDESYHDNFTQTEYDRRRQAFVEYKLNAKFIRLDYKDTDSYNIGLVVKEIMDMQRLGIRSEYGSDDVNTVMRAE